MLVFLTSMLFFLVDDDDIVNSKSNYVKNYNKR